VTVFDVPALKTRIEALEEKTREPDFWQDQERARTVSQEAADLKGQRI